MQRWGEWIQVKIALSFFFISKLTLRSHICFWSFAHEGHTPPQSNRWRRWLQTLRDSSDCWKQSALWTKKKKIFKRGFVKIMQWKFFQRLDAIVKKSAKIIFNRTHGERSSGEYIEILTMKQWHQAVTFGIAASFTLPPEVNYGGLHTLTWKPRPHSSLLVD